MAERITFDKHDAAHLYELALEHFQVGPDCDCHTCHKLKDRLQKFIGPSEVVSIHRNIRENGYCKSKKKK